MTRRRDGKRDFEPADGQGVHFEPIKHPEISHLVFVKGATISPELLEPE
jgi:hypothetical protein